MPKQEAVFSAADAMVAEGEEPSVRTLTPRLKYGGKTKLICQFLREWREARSHYGKADETLNARLRVHLTRFGNEAYRIAQQEVARVYVRERAHAADVRKAELVDLEHLLGQLEQAEAENVLLIARADAASAEAVRTSARLIKVENQLDRFRAEEFWNRVMQEIHEILPTAGTMHPDDILPELRSCTFRRAALHKEPLTSAVLKKKMDMRARHGKFFEKHPDWHYGRRVG